MIIYGIPAAWVILRYENTSWREVGQDTIDFLFRSIIDIVPNEIKVIPEKRISLFF